MMNEQSLDLEKFRSSLTCAICLGHLVHPFAIACGHSFCYGCLSSWMNVRAAAVASAQRPPVHGQDGNPADRAKAHTTCPVCRQSLRTLPSRCLALSELTDTLVKAVGTADEQQQYARRLQLSTALMERDTAQGQVPLWDGLMTGDAVVDADDGVRRCHQCLWEVVGNECANCGCLFSDLPVGVLEAHPDDESDAAPGDGGESAYSTECDEFGNDLDEYLSTDDDGVEGEESVEEWEDSEVEEDSDRRRPRRKCVFVDEDAYEDSEGDSYPRWSEAEESEQEPRTPIPSRKRRGAAVIESDNEQDDEQEAEEDEKKENRQHAVHRSTTRPDAKKNERQGIQIVQVHGDSSPLSPRRKDTAGSSATDTDDAASPSPKLKKRKKDKKDKSRKDKKDKKKDKKKKKKQKTDGTVENVLLAM